MWNDKVAPIIFTKLINNERITYNLYLSAHSDLVLKDGKGIIVVFTDSTIWRKPGRIIGNLANNGCDYTMTINVTQEDVSLFSTKSIAKYMLYIFDQEMNAIEATEFKTAVKCVIESR